MLPTDLDAYHDFKAAARRRARKVLSFGNIAMQYVIRASTWGFGPTDLDAYHDFRSCSLNLAQILIVFVKLQHKTR